MAVTNQQANNNAKNAKTTKKKAKKNITSYTGSTRNPQGSNNYRKKCQAYNENMGVAGTNQA